MMTGAEVALMKARAVRETTRGDTTPKEIFPWEWVLELVEEVERLRAQLDDNFGDSARRSRS